MTIERWIRDLTDQKLRARVLELRQRYEFLSKRLFSSFEPTTKATTRDLRDFMVRIEHWLDQFCSEQHQLAAYQSVEYLFFAGPEEFEELYRCALVEVERWLSEHNDIDPFGTQDGVRQELARSWFCPVTDSFRINSFLHVAGISGRQFRPDWWSLSKFGDKKKIAKYVKSKNIRTLVLLEDFVGSGTQATRVLKFADSIAERQGTTVLFVPLIICAPGVQKIMDESSLLPSVRLRPIIVLSNNCLVSPKPNPGEPGLFDLLREVMRSHFKRLKLRLSGKEFGFGQVGSMVVTYSNCPNNTLPIFHKAREDEIALFPRQPRPWD